ncbi:MAG: AI-2E family transporter [Victivallales bacterium]|nr:AI-2E family transporter [Victivallales bacterium]
MEHSTTDNSSWAPTIAKVTFLLLTLGMLCAAVYLVRNVLHAIILGALLAGILMPVNRWLTRRIARFLRWLDAKQNHPRAKASPEKFKNYVSRVSKALGAGLSVVLVFLVIVIPLTMLVVHVAKEGRSTIVSALEWIEKDYPVQSRKLIAKYHLEQRREKLNGYIQDFSKVANEADQAQERLKKEDSAEVLPVGKEPEQPPVEKQSPQVTMPTVAPRPIPEKPTDLNQLLAQLARRAIAALWRAVLAVLSRTWLTIFNFFIMLFVMYHIFHDGEEILAYFRSITPLGDETQQQVSRRIREVSRAVCFSIFGTACVQALLSMIVFRIVGIPALFWGVVLGFCSIIPFVGTGLVWVPAMIYLFMTGQTWHAIFLLIACGGLVANIDSLVRPLLMKQGGNTGMSYLVLFFSILGGLQTFGLVGILYGPLIVGICGICLLIFATQFKKRNAEPSPSQETT